MRSTKGMRKTSPGPFALSNFPRRKTTPRSYSRKMRTAAGSTRNASSSTGINHATLATSVSIGSILYLLEFAFYLQVQTVPAGDLHRVPGIHRRVAGGVPNFAFHEHRASRGIDPADRGRRLSHHRLPANAHGQQLRLQSCTDHECEKGRRA